MLKIALVTTPPSVRSGIGDYTRSLVPHLKEWADVACFVAPGLEGEPLAGEPTRSVLELRSRNFDQILYQLGNEVHHGFMAPMVRDLGGTVALHDWVLFDLALSAFPALARGGVKGHMLALREGGIRQTEIYLQSWLGRREQKRRPAGRVDTRGLDGTLLAGWHLPEPTGRWTGDLAFVRIPSASCTQVAVEFSTEPGRTVRLLEGDSPRAELICRSPGSAGRLVTEIRGRWRPEIALETTGIEVSEDQRRYGDSRRLGTFVRSIQFLDAGGWHELDLSVPAAQTLRTLDLSVDRFRLPLNRSVVRHADAFLVHSDYVKKLVLASRNAPTAIGVVQHGAEACLLQVDRALERRRLGLHGPWLDGFLVVSFGNVQPHKRTDKLLEALARVRATRPGIHAAVVGRLFPEEFDAVDAARRLGLQDAVKFTGYLPASQGQAWLRAGNLAVNLRGPTSGGTSGGIFQALAAGRAVIASDAAEQRELPESCVLKIPAGDGEIDALSRLLADLHDRRDRVEQLENAARAFVEAECLWSVTAARIVQLLESFPTPRSARRGWFAFRGRSSSQSGARRG